MEVAKKSRGRQVAHVVGGALGGALFVGLFWSLYDALLLDVSGVSFWRNWAFSAAAATWVAMLVTPVAAMVGALGAWVAVASGAWGRVETFASAHPRHVAAVVLVGALMIGVTALGLFGLYLLVAANISESGWQGQYALAFGTVSLHLVMLISAWRAVAYLASWLEGVRDPRVLRVLPYVGVVGTLVLGIVLFSQVAPSVWEAVAFRSYVVLPLLFGAALLGGLFAPTRPQVLRVVAGFSALTLTLTAMHFRAPMPEPLEDAIEVKSSGAGFVWERFTPGNAIEVREDRP